MRPPTEVDLRLPAHPVVVTRYERGALLRYHRHYDSCALQRVLAAPDQALADPAAQILKFDRTTTVAAISFDSRKFVLKRYNARNLWHIVSRAPRRTRATACWGAARRLLDLGIATAPPVAMRERRFGPLRGHSWYLTEHVGGEHALDFFTRNADSGQREVVAQRIVALLRCLTGARIAHGDLKASNIVLVAGWPILVDLDATHWPRTVPGLNRALARDRRRFMKNWRAMPDVAALFERLLSEAG